MAPRQTNTRQQIVEHARNLVQCCGFDGFSYRDIATPLGIRNAAIHYHFPCKGDLGVAVLEDWLHDLEQEIAAAQEQNLPPTCQVDEFFIRSEKEAEEGWKVCPFGALSINHEQLPAPMQELMVAIRKTVHHWLSENLEAGRAAGTIHFTGNADTKALVLAAAIQGARQISKVMEKNVVTQVANQLREELFHKTN